MEKKQKKGLIRKGVRYAGRELTSLAVLTAGAACFLNYGCDSSFFDSLREGVKQARHSVCTADEIVRGTQGERAVQSLEEYFANVPQEELRELNRDASENLENIKETVGNLARTYEENEKLARQCNRLGTQLAGMVTELTAVGVEAVDNLTFGAFKKIDDALMDTFGSAEDARQKLPELQEIYRTARKFYDGREKLERTIGDVCAYLEQTEARAITENEKIDKSLDSLLSHLGATYTTEDKVFSVTDKVNLLYFLVGKNREKLTDAEVRNLEMAVQKYRGDVDDGRIETENAVPIGSYERPDAWVDYTLNPMVLGAVMGLTVKGASTLTKPTRKIVNRATLFPFYALGKIAQGTYFVGSKILERLKKDGGGK